MNGEGYLSEDTPGSIRLFAQTRDATDELTTMVITGLVWGLAAGELDLLDAEAAVDSAEFADGTLTIVFAAGVESFEFASLVLTPSEDSDVDLDQVTATVSVRDKSDTSKTEQTVLETSLVVDAVADGGAVIESSGPEISTAGSVADLNLTVIPRGDSDGMPDDENPGGFDDDGSEAVSQVVVTLSGDGVTGDSVANLLFDASDGGVVTHLNGSLVWTFTGSEAEIQAIVASLQVDPADDLLGTIAIRIDVTTLEAATASGGDQSAGAEVDEADNTVTETFTFELAVEPRLTNQVQHRYAPELRWASTMTSSISTSVLRYPVCMQTGYLAMRSAA